MRPDELFNEYLHGARGAMLSRLPTPHVMVSAGCNGTPFFKWVEQHTGFKGRHIGVEYYCPKPDDLPPNVEWIANTVGSMPEVPSGVADALFSGPNIEHLWADEVVGFLLESHRILQIGGRLIVDSPNRAVTAEHCWTHPEHTIEFVVDEACDLLRLAGFDIAKKVGLWLSRDAAGKPIPLMPENEASAAIRLVAGLDRPEDCFIWWIEALRAVHAPDKAAIEARLAEIYAAAWSERLARFQKQVGRVLEDERGRFVVSEPGESGFILYGPYLPLRPGRYVAALDIEVTGAGEAIAEIRSVKGEIAKREIVKSGRVSFPFECSETTFGLEFRAFATGSGCVRARHDLMLTEAA